MHTHSHPRPLPNNQSLVTLYHGEVTSPPLFPLPLISLSRPFLTFSIPRLSFSLTYSLALPTSPLFLPSLSLSLHLSLFLPSLSLSLRLPLLLPSPPLSPISLYLSQPTPLHKDCEIALISFCTMLMLLMFHLVWERWRVEGLLPAGAAWQTGGTEDTRLTGQSVTVSYPP